MSDPAPAVDPLFQMMMNNIPETVEDMRKMLDGFAGMLNSGRPRSARSTSRSTWRDVPPK